jgi:hypothetical protein
MRDLIVENSDTKEHLDKFRTPNNRRQSVLDGKISPPEMHDGQGRPVFAKPIY